VAGTLALQMTTGEGAELVVHERHELVERLARAATPPV
jgi:hypothetical protein